MQSWITSAIDTLGYFGVALLMFFENLFPPIPSEVVMPLSGYVAAKGDLSLIGIIVAGNFGSVAGAIFWYYVAHWFGEDRLRKLAGRHGKWITVGPGDLDKADRWFHSYGSWAVLFARVVPGLRTLIAIPAGLFGMPLGKYILMTTIGSFLWTGGLAVLGYMLGKRWSEIGNFIGPVTYGVVGIIALVYIYRVLTFGRAAAKAGTGPGARR